MFFFALNNFQRVALSDDGLLHGSGWFHGGKRGLEYGQRIFFQLDVALQLGVHGVLLYGNGWWRRQFCPWLKYFDWPIL